jgi:hypothetical protein
MFSYLPIKILPILQEKAQGYLLKEVFSVRHWWLKLVILSTWEAENWKDQGSSPAQAEKKV